MADPKLETNKGTDQPWAHPGNLAQNPGAGPSREHREKEYEGVSDGDRSGYPGKTASKTVSNEPVHGTSNLNAEGRVGDPLPLVLLAIIVTGIVAAVAGAAWFSLRL
jgi:hypothetical protein